MSFFTELQNCFSSGDVMGVIHCLNIHYFFRLVVAAFCGFMIGRERKNRAKEAGVRTHCIVACAAALMMLVSKYAYFDLISGNLFPNADVRLDPSRVASTIVSGIGFLGTGMIFVHRQTVTGLTTAAGIWATAGIGMAIGGGMYGVGIAATILILIVQGIFHRSTMLSKTFKSKTLYFGEIDDLSFKDDAQNYLEGEGVHVIDVCIDKKGESYDIEFLLEVPNDYNEKEIITHFNRDCSLKAAI